MDEPCDICGDVGVSDVVATCSLCKIATEHIYCMKKLLLELPDDWICEACEMGTLISPKDVKENLPNPHTSPAEEPIANRYKSGNNVKTGKVQYISPDDVVKLSSGAKKFESPTKFSLLSRPGPSKNVSTMSAGLSIKPKGAKSAHLKFLPLSVIEDSCSRAAGQFPPRHSSNPINQLVNQQQAQTSRDTREKKTYQVPRKEHVHKAHAATRDFPAAPVMPPLNTGRRTGQASKTEYICNGQPKETVIEEKPKDRVVPSIETDSASTKKVEIADKRICAVSQVTSPLDTEKRTCQASKTEYNWNGQLKDIVTPCTEMGHNITEEKVIADRRRCTALLVPPPNEGCMEESRNSDANKGALVKILPGTERYFPLPALDASWNGSFEILDTVCSKVNGGLRAHPPAEVLKKVYEFSKRMPEVLQFRLFTRNNVWNDIFKGDCPDANDIGLYFFSNNHKSENYSFLMDFIEKQNLGLSCYMDGVELLVFPSRLLTAESQRWSGQYFLWGIFRRVKKSTKVRCTSDNKLAIVPHPSDFTIDQRTVGHFTADDKLAIVPLPSEFSNHEKNIGECTADNKLAIVRLPSEFSNHEKNIGECTADNSRLAIVPHSLEFPSLEETTGDDVDDDGVMDMDIDMIGGRIVGSVDIPVPRESSNRTLETSSQQMEMSTPPSKKVKFKLCSPPPGFGPCAAMRIRSNPPMVKPLQVDRTLARSPKRSRINFDRTPSVGLMRH